MLFQLVARNILWTNDKDLRAFLSWVHLFELIRNIGILVIVIIIIILQIMIIVTYSQRAISCNFGGNQHYHGGWSGKRN